MTIYLLHPIHDELAENSAQPFPPLEPENSPILIGRLASCAIALDESLAGDQHAQLGWDADSKGWLLSDLGTPFGTQLQQPAEAEEQHLTATTPPVPLQPRAIIIIGRTLLRFAVEEKEEELVTSVEDRPPEKEKQVAKIASTPPFGGDGNEPPNRSIIVNGQNGQQFPAEWAELGLEQNFSRLMQYLPTLYDVPFMHRFLGLFESLLAPLMWTADNVDTYLDPWMTPAEFVPWLASWYDFTFDHTWREETQRELLTALPTLYRCWGTKMALQKILEIYIDASITIEDEIEGKPYLFRVTLDVPEMAVYKPALNRLIQAHKPAHTQYELAFAEEEAAA